MRQKTTASLGRRFLNSSFHSWSGAKLFRHLVGASGGHSRGNPHDEKLSQGEMDRRREQLNQILRQVYREKLAHAEKPGTRYSRPLWTCFPKVTA